MELAGAAEAVFSVDGEAAVRAGDAFDAVVLADIEFVVGGDQAVVLEGFIAGGLGVGAGKGNVSDFEQLGGGEEGHVGGVVEERVADAAFVDEYDAEAGFLGFNCAGEAGGPGADDQKVVNWVWGRESRVWGMGYGVWG